jgi:nitrogen regulatory protein PII 2
MKEIMAIIRMNRMNETKRALSDAGFTSMTATGHVLGRGKGIVDHGLLKAADDGNEYAAAMLGQSPQLRNKRMIFMTVSEGDIKKAVDTIIKVNQSGMAGDGKIFILPMAESYRVRTGESGDDILQ